MKPVVCAPRKLPTVPAARASTLCQASPDVRVGSCAGDGQEPHPPPRLPPDPRCHPPDINECLRFGTCSQLCNNTKGGHLCSCARNFMKTHNTCKAEGDRVGEGQGGWVGPVHMEIENGAGLEWNMPEHTSVLRHGPPESRFTRHHPKQSVGKLEATDWASEAL